MMIEQAFNSKKLSLYNKWQDIDKMPEGCTNKLEFLRQRINDEDYLNAAVQRLAHVMSYELTEITSKGGRNEQRKRRK